MNVEGFGGLQFFSINEIQEDNLEVEVVLRTPLNDIEESSKILLDPKTISNESNLNRFTKIDINRKILASYPNIKLKSIVFETGENKSIISIDIAGKTYKNITIDWQYTYENLKIDAPQMSGDYVIDTRLFNQETYNSYLEYLRKGISVTDSLVGRMNLMLFLENLETQRISHILNTMLSLTLLLEYKRNLFKSTSSIFSVAGIEFFYSIKVNSNFVVNLDLAAKVDNNIYNIHTENGVDFNAIAALYEYELKKDIKISKLNRKQSNSKYTENNIFLEKDNEIIYNECENVITNYLLSGAGFIVNQETLELIEVFSPEEYIKTFVNDLIKPLLKNKTV